ncbi:hypothetical protein [Gracilibacillus massiliensis]|uniref:hypothetical protein n=1 Tax=Gracilibacillus massiliensis TaxID=1564956 RepID=UPI00071D9C8F|nr:hypothetical protein [Gracilibacillus massiliensis]
MESSELRKMRKTQFLVMNGLIVSILVTFILLIRLIDITFSQFFLGLGIILLVQSVLRLAKGESTKSWIPIFEQVAYYEKHKMGKEWKKQLRMNNIWNLILSGIIFLQYYLYRDATDSTLQPDLIFMLAMTFFLFVIVNISLFFHIRKIDRSNSVTDLKGYTWKSNLVGIIMGIGFAMIVIMVTIFYVISTI